MREIAPWPDFTGHQIREGDRIIHPNGDSGFVVFMPGAATEAEQWRVDYGHGTTRSLAIEVSDKGRATIVDETGSAQ